MSELKKLTRLGADTKKIAALLQKKAPPGHKLAYINDEEAALLKSRGGSGKPHEDTGIPSYELDDGFALQGDTSAGPSEVAPMPQTYGGDTFSSGDFVPQAPAPVSPTAVSGEAAQLSSFPQIQQGLGTATSPYAARDIAAGEAALTAPQEAPAAPKGVSDDTLKRLGLAGALGFLGSRQAAKAGEAGQKGATQMQQLAAPYQKTGADLQAAATRGELTPAAQQSLQAVQAQAAQGAERRGGVGAQQAAQQVEQFRQQLLQQQYDYGLKLSGIGDNIALGAIKTGMQADQYVNQLTNQFYTNMAYVASGMSPGIRIGG